MEKQHVTTWVKPLAKAGLSAKGIVYCLSGLLAFMAAFELGGQSSTNADKQGVFSFVQHQSGGRVLLALIAAGLVCYFIWRVVQAFADTEQKGKSAKGISKRLRYILSGIVYLSLAVFAIRILLHSESNSNGSSQQNLAQQLMNKPLGQWLVGIVALVIAGIGIYQIYYGLSEKYKKHVGNLSQSASSNTLLRFGKIGYSARGLVYLIIAYLMFRASLHANAAEAGNTGDAFQYLENASYGSYLLGALGLGLICYGIFSFIRARYESFG